MLPILYLILMKRNGTPYSEVTVVSLPSSLMIVHSNAFVFSTSLPEVVFRYGFFLKTLPSLGNPPLEVKPPSGLGANLYFFITSAPLVPKPPSCAGHLPALALGFIFRSRFFLNLPLLFLYLSDHQSLAALTERRLPGLLKFYLDVT